MVVATMTEHQRGKILQGGWGRLGGRDGGHWRDRRTGGRQAARGPEGPAAAGAGMMPLWTPNAHDGGDGAMGGTAERGKGRTSMGGGIPGQTTGGSEEGQTRPGTDTANPPKGSGRTSV